MGEGEAVAGNSIIVRPRHPGFTRVYVSVYGNFEYRDLIERLMEPRTCAERRRSINTNEHEYT